MTNYIRINKKLYGELQDFTESQAYQDIIANEFKKPLVIRELECHPVKIEYYADEDLFRYWYPIRTENDPYRRIVKND